MDLPDLFDYIGEMFKKQQKEMDIPDRVEDPEYYACYYCPEDPDHTCPYRWDRYNKTTNDEFSREEKIRRAKMGINCLYVK